MPPPPAHQLQVSITTQGEHLVHLLQLHGDGLECLHELGEPAARRREGPRKGNGRGRETAEDRRTALTPRHLALPPVL